VEPNKGQGLGQKKMLGRLRNTFSEISLPSLERNYKKLAGLASLDGAGGLIPMVKADAYGHGDVQVARTCERLGAHALGVVLIEEGMRLRMAGVQARVLVFGQFDAVGAEQLVRYRLTPVLSEMGQFEKLKAVLPKGSTLPVHVKFNTGMQRLGFEPAQAAEVAGRFARESDLVLEGVCTHFVAGNDAANPEGITARQMKMFSTIQQEFSKLAKPAIFHTKNSAALLLKMKPGLDCSRPGLALYGATPPLDQKINTVLEPVMSIKSSVAFLHTVRKGEGVSYSASWKAKRDSVIAVIPIGYAVGYPRALSNKAEVLLRGERCPVAGIVCMDYSMIDVTDLAQKREIVLGEEVVLMGAQGAAVIGVEELANWAGSIPYEILTGIQARVPRVYLH
jgi:alanine racemase